MVAGVLEQLLELGEIELQIGVAEEDEIAACGGQARSQRCAVAGVRGVTHEADARIEQTPAIDDVGARVLAAVVDDHDLELGGEPGADAAGRANEFVQVPLFVEDRKHQRQAGTAEPGRGHSRYPSARSRSATMASSSSV